MWRALPTLLVPVALLAAACDGGTEVTLVCPSKGTPQAPPDLSSLSLDEVYERMGDSMTCPGYVLHVVTREESEIVYPQEGEFSFTVSSAAWIDLLTGRAREEADLSYVPSGEDAAEDGEDAKEGMPRSVKVVLGDAAYRGETAEDPARGFRALVCHESNSALLSLLLDCAGYTEDSVTRVDPGAEYEGHRMPALVTEGDTSGSDEFTVFAQHLYLDGDILLPVVSVTEGIQNNKRPFKSEVSYEYTFVSLDSLSEDFFEPAAIGYVEPDPEENLRGVDVGITLYWLGVEFPGTENLPALSLDRAHAAVPSPEAPPFLDRGTLDYRLAQGQFGPSVVSLRLYARADWDAFLAQSHGGNVWDSACVQNIELNLGDRRAVVFGGRAGPSRQCPGTPTPRGHSWGAYVYIGDTVVLISAAFRQEPGVQSARSLYNSREGMELIIRSLVPRPAD